MITWNQRRSDRFKAENIIIPRNSVGKRRLVEGSLPDRSFDIAFWQEQGDEAILAAAWDMVEPAEEISHGRKSTLPLQLLNEFEVEYLIVGGFAVMKHGEPRYTKDLDVCSGEGRDFLHPARNLWRLRLGSVRLSQLERHVFAE